MIKRLFAGLQKDQKGKKKCIALLCRTISLNALLCFATLFLFSWPGVRQDVALWLVPALIQSLNFIGPETWLRPRGVFCELLVDFFIYGLSCLS